MVIGCAVDRAGSVCVYDTDGRFLFSRSGTLHNFTGSSVSVRRDFTVFVYDENGYFLYSRHC